jgi:hypothetical protein
VTALTLYELGLRYQSLEVLADSEDLPAEVIKDTLEGLEGEFDSKALAVAKFILSLDAHAEAVRDAAHAMETRAIRMEKRAGSIKSYLQFWLQAMRKRKIESAELTVRLQANPPTVVITDEAAIPERFWVQPEPPPKRIDKKALKAALDAGERIDGAYIDKGEHLRIVV